MSRYVNNLTLNQPDNFVNFIMNDFAQKNSYQPFQWKGEPCLRCGDGMFEGYKFLKWSYQNGVLHLEAWLKGTFGGEMGLDGFWGMIPKKTYRSNIESLISVLMQPLPAEAYQNTNNGENAMPTAPIVVQTVDQGGNAVAALILGILSIPAALLWALLGLVLGCLGYGLARAGKNSSKKNMALAGSICAIIGVVVAIVVWLLNVVFGVAGLFLFGAAGMFL